MLFVGGFGSGFFLGGGVSNKSVGSQLTSKILAPPIKQIHTTFRKEFTCVHHQGDMEYSRIPMWVKKRHIRNAITVYSYMYVVHINLEWCESGCGRPSQMCKEGCNFVMILWVFNNDKETVSIVLG